MMEPVITTHREGALITVTILCDSDTAATQTLGRLREVIRGGAMLCALRAGSMATEAANDVPVTVTPAEVSTPR
jgi:hypothetical protein